MENDVIEVSPSVATEKHRIIKRVAGHALPALIIVAAIWIPFGFAMTGVVEEWLVLGPFTTHGLFFLTGLNSPMSAHALRPLTIFPQAIAYFLDPQSFKYWHIMLILSLLVKAWCLSLITTKITNSLKWGIAASVLFLVYPADTMQLSFRSLHINWSLALALLATTLFLYSIESKNKALSVFGSVTSAAIFTAACAMYEASLLLSILPLLVLWTKGGNSHAIQKLKHTLPQFLMWLSGPIIYIMYVAVTARLISTYQGDIIGQSSIIQTIESSLPRLFSVGLLRSILGGWFDATRITILEFTTYWYALATLIFLAISTTLTLRSSQNSLNHDKKINTLAKAGRLLCSGIVLVILGYAPFLISVPHQYISQRTFLFSTLGAVFFAIGLLIAAYKLSKTFTAVSAAALVFIGLSFQLYQFHHYVKISNTQVSILREISQKFDGNARGKTLLILDNSNQIGHTWMLPDGNLRGALTYLYGHPIDSVEVCHLPSHEWQKADGLARKGVCEENTLQWIFHYPDPVSGPGMDIQTKKEDITLDKASLIVINIVGDANINPTPSQTIPLNKTVSSFANNVATPARYLSFTDEKRKDFYHWNFGKWWSMEIPTKGSGWREGEWKVSSFYHESAAWKTSKASYLYFPFYAKQKKYTLSGNFDYIVSSSIKDSMKLLLNGKEIPIHWRQNGEFQAPVAPEQLVSGTNELTFISDVDEKYYGFSARLSWIEIKKSEQQ